MSETSDLAKEVRKLRGELAILRNEFAQVRGRQDVWAANGLDDMDSGHGNQRFGAGNYRLDKTGVQILRSLQGESRRGIFFVEDAYSDAPTSEAVRTELSGFEQTLIEGTSLNHHFAGTAVSADITQQMTYSSRQVELNLTVTNTEAASGHQQAYISSLVDPVTDVAKVQIYAPDGVEISTDAVTWTPVGGGGWTPNVTAQTTTYTAADGDVVICTSGTFTVTLPAATADRVVVVKNVGSGTITVDGASSDTIDDVASIVLAQYDSVTLIADGTEWWVI